MTTSKRIITIAAACVGLAALLTYAGAAQSLKVDFRTRPSAASRNRS